MSLWRKPIDAITWQDVLEFLDLRLSEGTQLDYKREFPSNLEKHLAAFANTLGGHLLIGVDQDRDTGVPIVPPACVPLAGLDSRVEQKGLQALYPGFVPDVRLVENPEQIGHGIAVVRVHESPQAPHSIENTRKIYVRTGQHSQPEDLAELSWIERLLDRRRLNESSREVLIETAKGRADHFRPRYVWSSLSVTPLYVQARFETPKTVLKWARDHYLSARFSPLAGGAFSVDLTTERDQTRLSRYIEHQNLGLSYFAESWIPEETSPGIGTLDLRQIVHVLARDLQNASRFLDRIGFNGYILIRYELLRAANVRLYWPSYRDEVRYADPPDLDHRAQMNCAADQLMSDDIVFRLVNEIRWSLGYQEFQRTDWMSALIASARFENSAWHA